MEYIETKLAKNLNSPPSMDNTGAGGRGASAMVVDKVEREG